ncbi:MAG: hypothetical protein ACLU6W_09525 [Lachnospiraceae bacterium]|nr:hypothetical protein [Candidatus Fimimorpha excrementavium]
MIVMVLVFTILYPITIAREGFEYKNAILIPHQENGNTIYSGKIQGKQASFAVYADKTVEFQYNGRIYGPYIAKEDPTAIPKDSEVGESMTGVELRHGEEILFRGGVLDLGDYHLLYSEDGSLENINISVTTSDGIVMDENGNVIDPMEPSVSTILDLMAGPELTHKGGWPAWFGGVFVCIVTTILILFADELFRWNLVFRIRNVDQAEPSDWEIASRYIAWTVLPLMAMIIFIRGLQ